MADPVVAVRRFNRSYTQRIGVLEDSFLGLGLPLGPARLLFEIGATVQAPLTTQALRERLGLDSGDRRRRLVSLTAAGREHWAELERRSDDQARGIVDPLTPRQRDRLARALAEADLLVRAATVTIEPADPASPAGRDVVGRYFAEIGRRFGFDPAGETDKDARLLVPPTGLFVLAVSDGEPVACGGLQAIAAGVGELKRMWVHDGWRGVGLGSRLLRHLEDAARAAGHAAVRLDTNAALTEAIAMYQRAGYRPVPRYNDNPWATHFFEKKL